MVNFKYRAGDGGAGGPAVHRVIVGAGLSYLDLASDGCILPLHLGDLSGAHIDGFQPLVHDIALIFQFSEIVAARLCQIVDIDISPVIRGILTNRLMVAVIEQENGSGDARAVRVYLVDENTADGLVGHSFASDLPILHREIDGGGVQAERAGTVGFHRIVITGF